MEHVERLSILANLCSMYLEWIILDVLVRSEAIRVLARGVSRKRLMGMYPGSRITKCQSMDQCAKSDDGITTCMKYQKASY